MDDARAKALSAGANMSTGGVNFNYVDTAKLDRMGINRYDTKKPKGNNFIRIVAPDTSGPFAREIHQHTQIGASKATYLCLDKMYGEVCPICEHIQELRRQNVNSDAVKELLSGRRFLLFVVDTTSPDTEDEGPKWFDCPITIYKEVCVHSEDRRTGAKIDPTDPEDGRDVEFVRKDGKRTDYVGFKLTKTEPIPKSWYEDLPSFDEILLKPNPAEMEVAVKGVKSTAFSEKESTASSEKESSGDSRRSGRSRERISEEVKPGTEVKEEATKESSRESRRESRREPETNDQDTEQATAVQGKIAEIQNRRRARE